MSSRRRRRNLQRAVLTTVAAAGILSVALLAPNALQALKVFDSRDRKGTRDSVARAQARLLRKGLLRKEGWRLSLTARGESVLARLEGRNPWTRKPPRWDGKWRVLVFDIPEPRKAIREKIRRTLVSTGFVKLQDSVWLFPYPCEDLVALLKADFKVGKDMLYLVVAELERDGAYRKRFGLQAG